jgi:hypothetical protein
MHCRKKYWQRKWCTSFCELEFNMRLSDIHLFSWTKGRKDVKVLRHRDPSVDLWEYRQNGYFQKYQEQQAWNVFGKAQYVISFIAERNRYAKFVGVWQIHGKKQTQSGRFRYSSEELTGYDELERRLVIEWGEGTRSWAQWLHGAGDKRVIEILPPNYVADFPGFYNFTLTYDQLRELIQHPDSNREWYRMLRSVSGIYVILDKRTRKQYIGSAYGTGGIWGRWKSYAKSPSGGNRLLRKRLEKNPNAFKNFQFSILRVLESGATRDQVIAEEVWAKNKLGSRAFGLNS